MKLEDTQSIGMTTATSCWAHFWRNSDNIKHWETTLINWTISSRRERDTNQWINLPSEQFGQLDKNNQRWHWVQQIFSKKPMREKETNKEIFNSMKKISKDMSHKMERGDEIKSKFIQWGNN